MRQNVVDQTDVIALPSPGIVAPLHTRIVRAPQDLHPATSPRGKSAEVTQRHRSSSDAPAKPVAGGAAQPQWAAGEPSSAQAVAPPEVVSTSSCVLPQSMRKDFELNQDPSLGSGAFARIFSVYRKITGQRFALKVMERSLFSGRCIEYLIENEINSMKRCVREERLRRVVRLFDDWEEDGMVYLRMELCQTSLFSYVNSLPNHHATEGFASLWAAQLLLGLDDLHSIGILHRDIKPDNLLLATDGSLKIADFGWSIDVSENSCSLAGTFEFMAPEVLAESSIQTPAIDVWSSGVTMFQLLMGRCFLAGGMMNSTGMSMNDCHLAALARCSSLLDEIDKRCPLKDDERPSFISSVCWDFLRQTMDVDFETRIRVRHALDHDWIREIHKVFEKLDSYEFGRSPMPEISPVASGDSMCLPTNLMGLCLIESVTEDGGSLRESPMFTPRHKVTETRPADDADDAHEPDLDGIENVRSAALTEWVENRMGQFSCVAEAADDLLRTWRKLPRTLEKNTSAVSIVTSDDAERSTLRPCRKSSGGISSGVLQSAVDEPRTGTRWQCLGSSDTADGGVRIAGSGSGSASELRPSTSACALTSSQVGNWSAECVNRLLSRSVSRESCSRLQAGGLPHRHTSDSGNGMSNPRARSVGELSQTTKNRSSSVSFFSPRREPQKSPQRSPRRQVSNPKGSLTRAPFVVPAKVGEDGAKPARSASVASPARASSPATQNHHHAFRRSRTANLPTDGPTEKNTGPAPAQVGPVKKLNLGSSRICEVPPLVLGSVSTRSGAMRAKSMGELPRALPSSLSLGDTDKSPCQSTPRVLVGRGTAELLTSPRVHNGLKSTPDLGARRLVGHAYGLRSAGEGTGIRPTKKLQKQRSVLEQAGSSRLVDRVLLKHEAMSATCRSSEVVGVSPRSMSAEKQRRLPSDKSCNVPQSTPRVPPGPTPILSADLQDQGQMPKAARPTRASGACQVSSTPAAPNSLQLTPQSRFRSTSPPTDVLSSSTIASTPCVSQFSLGKSPRTRCTPTVLVGDETDSKSVASPCDSPRRIARSAAGAALANVKGLARGCGPLTVPVRSSMPARVGQGGSHANFVGMPFSHQSLGQQGPPTNPTHRVLSASRSNLMQRC